MNNRDLFYQGRYQDLLARTIDTLAGHVAHGDLPFIIWALPFRDQMIEAPNLYDLHRARFCRSSDFRVAWVTG